MFAIKFTALCRNKATVIYSFQMIHKHYANRKGYLYTLPLTASSPVWSSLFNSDKTRGCSPMTLRHRENIFSTLKIAYFEA